MQNFMLNHTPAPTYEAAASFFGDVPGVAVASRLASAVDTVFQSTPLAAAHSNLITLTAAYQQAPARAIDRCISSSGCILLTDGEAIASAFRVELPEGTDPFSLSYDDFVAQGLSFFSQPIVTNNGLSTLSWSQAHSFDVVTQNPGYAVYFGILIQCAKGTTPVALGRVSARLVAEDIPMYQPNRH